MRRARRAALVGLVLFAPAGLHLLAREAVASAVALAPNADGVARASSVPPAELAAHVVRDLEREAARSRSLAGWLVEPRSERRPGTIVLLHGVRSDSSLLGTFADAFALAGYRAVLVDLPGHGRSKGRYLTYGAAEAQRVQRYLDELEADALIGGEPIGVFGFSYGGAVALELAARDRRIASAVVVSSFASVRQVVNDYAAKYLPPPLTLVPEAWFQDAVDEAATVAGFDPDRGPLSAAARTSVPILYIHGAADDQVPPEHSRRLVRATARGELVIVPGLTHDGVPRDAAGTVRKRAREWFERWMR